MQAWTKDVKRRGDDDDDDDDIVNMLWLTTVFSFCRLLAVFEDGLF